MGTRLNRLRAKTKIVEAVLMCTHNRCFEQKYENNQNISTENCHFYSCEKIAVCCMGGFSLCKTQFTLH